ncbi:MAG: hypothetical protein AAGH92_00865 [Planctomycetota bacterium]
MPQPPRDAGHVLRPGTLTPPTPGLADVAVLIDAPPVARADRTGQDHLAEAMRHTLDACVQLGITGNAVLTVLRHARTPAQAVAETHAARPALLRPEGHAPPTDALPRPFTLLIRPGTTPDATTLLRALATFDNDETLAAVTGSAHRHDGAIETHVLPTALHGGAALVRTEALREAGGFSRLIPPGGAADLDLTCRLLRNGQRIQRFGDLNFDRPVWSAEYADASAAAASLRDALIVHERYLPRRHRRVLRRDAIAHARMAAVTPGTEPHFARATRDARRWAQWERKRGRATLSARPLEALLGWTGLRQRVADFAASHGIRRVVLAGLHPHVAGFMHAARAAGLAVDAIADDTHLLTDRPQHRGVPILPIDRAIRTGTEAVLISDLHPATTQRTAAAAAEHFAGPILFAPEMPNLPQIQADSTSATRAA